MPNFTKTKRKSLFIYRMSKPQSTCLIRAKKSLITLGRSYFFPKFSQHNEKNMWHCQNHLYIVLSDLSHYI